MKRQVLMLIDIEPDTELADMNDAQFLEHVQKTNAWEIDPAKGQMVVEYELLTPLQSVYKSRLDMVKEFHTTFKHGILGKPALPSQNRIDLRIALIAEEFKELQDAIKEGDLVEAFDALLDIEYVLLGTVLELGMQDLFDEGFEAVHQSNMSKVWPDGVPHYSESGKTIKSVTYQPVDLQVFIDNWELKVQEKFGMYEEG